ncbi:MAG: cytochrome c biogenesis protein CcdA [Treponema sp.]|jgi:cytochrome c-type biogenesis protein|nr:cytochrome c biogenesis protein CcdA [Treponema sp.]
MHYLLLFLEGIITFISPCHLPLLPVYISFFAAGETNRQKTFFNSLGFVIGFTIIFVILGAFAGTLGNLLRDHSTAVNIITGFIVIIFGLNFLGVIHIPLLNRTSQAAVNAKDLNFFSSMLFGIIFSIGWTPCTGAFLGSALMIASQSGGTMQGILMLLLYSLGLGIPFIASALLIDRLKGAFEFIKQNYRIINIVSGLLLVITGIFIATGLMARYLHILS